ncbi:MAG TPA: hypothetical protein VFU99_08040 [Gaiellaceae bacterium]|nr:hypothetical protein [Gaiellaceae bacterium]
MRRASRLSFTPGTAVALVALFFALGGSAFAVGERIQAPSVAQQRCTNGAVRGVATVTGVPSQGIANIPDRFTGAGNLFARKFNCTGKAVQVRRVETGVFEIRFVGVSGASAVASAFADDAYATVRSGSGGAFVVTMHPAGRDDRVDLGFTIVVV